MNMKENFLAIERILDWMEGQLTAEEAAVVATQVAQADAQTQSDVAWLKQFHRLSQINRQPQLPAAVRADLMQQFDEWRERRTAAARWATLSGWWEAIKAQLIFDSYAQLAVAGIRSAAAATAERQLVYNGRLAEIALNIQPQQPGPELTLWGQVFPLTETDLFSVQLLQNGSERELAVADELGEFAFPSLQPGLYDLIVSSDQGEIVINAIPLTT
jgi:hypothetical protein